MTPSVATFFGWLLHASWQAAVLALIVLALQWLLQKRVSAAWRHALWLLVIARLALPVSPRSEVSLFNFARLNSSPPAATVPAAAASVHIAGQKANAVPVQPFLDNDVPKAMVNLRDLPASQSPATTAVVTEVRPVSWFTVNSLSRAAALIWLIGVVALAARIIGQNVMFARLLRDRRLITDPGVVDLFERCKETFGLRFPIKLEATNAVGSPALYGWWRPALLLPNSLIPQFSREEMRYVFLHELAHVKRRDMAVHWVATVLGVLHWFNPVLWFAFRRMAADRELACDELVLGRAGESERRPYGDTILKLLESCARPAALPGLMGLLEDKDQMIRRITMIARFRKHPRWSVLAVVLMIGLAFATLTDAREETKAAPAPVPAKEVAVDPETNSVRQPRPDLVGQVKTKAGDALAKATVFISTAGPKVGSSIFCPSCYADCRKNAPTDVDGGFKITSLDPQLIFRILVAAPGYKPKFVGKVDPAKGPISVTLEPIAFAEATPDRSVRGKVVDPTGKPVYGATVEAHGIQRKNDSGSMYGTLPGVDPLAVTDEKGEFLLTAKEPFQTLALRVEARTFANKSFSGVRSGGDVHPLTLTEGSTITGQVVHDGKPLAGVSVGLVSANRGVEDYVGHFEIGTDADGRFSFVNLPAGRDYLVYGLMELLRPYGTIPAQTVKSLGDGETLEVGKLKVEPAQRLAGQVVLADGKPVPAKTRLLISREGAWDSMQILLDREGRFDVTGLPKEEVSLGVRIPGYRVSPQNQSLDPLNPYSLVGRMDGDITNLLFLMEKGKDVQPDYGQNIPESAMPQNRRLRGAEGTAEHEGQFVLQGLVRDRDTKELLEVFRITPGNQDANSGQTYLDKRNAVDGVDGKFIVYLDRKFSQPILKIEARGHLPRNISVLPESRTNLDFTLEKGAGPSGTVLLPDGQPAAGIALALLCTGEQNIQVTGAGELRSPWNKDALHYTDPDGSFLLEPEINMEKVAIAGKAGFKLVSVKELATNSRVTLEPWGRIKGVLHRGTTNSTDEPLDLAFEDRISNFLQLHVQTDGEGRFEFDQVPPGKITINGRIPMGLGGWQHEKLQEITLKPGTTAEVNIQGPNRTADRNTAATRNHAPERPKPLPVTGPPIEGTILLPDGKPAVNVEVALKVIGKYLALGRGRLKAYGAESEGWLVRSDAKGHFVLPGIANATGVVIVSEQGFAEVTLPVLKKLSQATIRPWGRIEGVLRVRGEPGTNQVVSLDAAEIGNFGLRFEPNDFQVPTDEDGRFIMTYVPPGERRLSRRMPRGDQSWTYSRGTIVDVKAGEITSVSLGDVGRTVRGRVVVTNAPVGLQWRNVQGYLHAYGGSGLYDISKAPFSEDVKSWLEQKSMESSMKNNLPYPLKLDENGGFAADEVTFGGYNLHIVFFDGDYTKLPPGTRPEVVGQINTGIIVRTPQTNSQNSVLDLGTLKARLEPFVWPPGVTESNR